MTLTKKQIERASKIAVKNMPLPSGDMILRLQACNRASESKPLLNKEQAREFIKKVKK